MWKSLELWVRKALKYRKQSIGAMVIGSWRKNCWEKHGQGRPSSWAFRPEQDFYSYCILANNLFLFCWYPKRLNEVEFWRWWMMIMMIMMMVVTMMMITFSIIVFGRWNLKTESYLAWCDKVLYLFKRSSLLERNILCCTGTIERLSLEQNPVLWRLDLVKSQIHLKKKCLYVIFIFLSKFIKIKFPLGSWKYYDIQQMCSLVT